VEEKRGTLFPRIDQKQKKPTPSGRRVRHVLRNDLGGSEIDRHSFMKKKRQKVKWEGKERVLEKKERGRLCKRQRGSVGGLKKKGRSQLDERSHTAREKKEPFNPLRGPREKTPMWRNGEKENDLLSGGKTPVTSLGKSGPSVSRKSFSTAWDSKKGRVPKKGGCEGRMDPGGGQKGEGPFFAHRGGGGSRAGGEGSCS